MSEPRQQGQRQRGEGWIFAEAVRRYREQHPASQSPSLAGYLCELCQDAPAVQWQPVPEGGEMGVCEAVPQGDTATSPRATLTTNDSTILSASPRGYYDVDGGCRISYRCLPCTRSSLVYS